MSSQRYSVYNDINQSKKEQEIYMFEAENGMKSAITSNNQFIN